MGDRGGKKDKDKIKQQHLRKQKQEEQDKRDKAQPAAPGTTPIAQPVRQTSRP